MAHTSNAANWNRNGKINKKGIPKILCRHLHLDRKIMLSYHIELERFPTTKKVNSKIEYFTFVFNNRKILSRLY